MPAVPLDNWLCRTKKLERHSHWIKTTQNTEHAQTFRSWLPICLAFRFHFPVPRACVHTLLVEKIHEHVMIAIRSADISHHDATTSTPGCGSLHMQTKGETKMVLKILKRSHSTSQPCNRMQPTQLLD
jgi:hypothetical protein